MSGYAFETRRVEKPWGHELHFALTDRYCGKVLVVLWPLPDVRLIPGANLQ